MALEVPASWRDAATAARSAIDGGAAALPLRWVDPALLHLTLRFLGEVDAGAVPPLQDALDRCLPPFDLSLALGAAGTFGAPQRTQVVWLAVAGEVDTLRSLAGRVEQATQEAGLPAEGRAFRPHLTLARVRRGASAEARRAVAVAVQAAAERPPVPARFTSVSLVRSYLGVRGPRYEVLSRHPR